MKKTVILSTCVMATWLSGCTINVSTGSLDMISQIGPGGSQAIHATGEQAEVTVMNNGPGIIMLRREDAPPVEVRVDVGQEMTVRGVEGGKGCFSAANISQQSATIRIRVRGARSLDVREPTAANARIGASIRQAVTPNDAPSFAVLTGDAKSRKLLVGTGTRISASRVVTCGHVWPPDAVLATVNTQVEALWGIIERGSGGGSKNDWAVLTTEPSEAPVYEVDPLYVPKPGEAIVICGYPAAERSNQFPEPYMPSLRVLDARVVPAPAGLPDADQLVFFRTERCDIRGMSGGPALAWDERRGKAVLFGIITESVTVRHDDAVADHVHAIRTLSFLDTGHIR